MARLGKNRRRSAGVRGALAGLGALALAGGAAFVLLGGSDEGPVPAGAPGATTSGSAEERRPADGTTTRVESAHLEPGPEDPVATDAPVPTDGSRTAVVLTFAEWDGAGSAVDAAGFVQGVVEDGGICTLTVSRGSAQVTAQGAAEADAATTTCGSLSVPGHSLAPGSWQVRLSYTSAGVDVSSDVVTVEVPEQ